MNVCWPNGLYDAIIYIYNNGMKDFVTPAEELLGVLIKVSVFFYLPYTVGKNARSSKTKNQEQVNFFGFMDVSYGIN